MHFESIIKKDNTYIGMAKVQVTTLLDSDLHFQMKRRGLKFTDAIRLGSIKMMQMEDGGGDKAMNENINKHRDELSRIWKSLGSQSSQINEIRKEKKK